VCPDCDSHPAFSTMGASSELQMQALACSCEQAQEAQCCVTHAAGGACALSCK
jgi:hypothetical protein